jgi:hypothetical protein
MKSLCAESYPRNNTADRASQPAPEARKESWLATYPISISPKRYAVNDVKGARSACISPLTGPTPRIRFWNGWRLKTRTRCLTASERSFCIKPQGIRYHTLCASHLGHYIPLRY